MKSAMRSLSRRPIFALAAIVTVALGVGANTAMFSVIYAVLLQPLPFHDPAELVQIWESHPALPQLQLTVPDFQDFRRRSTSFQQMAAYTLSAMNTTSLLGQGDPEIVHATMAGSELFSTMGMRPLVGRAFSADEESRQQKLVLLSENLWRRKFAADPAISGKQIRLQDGSFIVTGVVPQRQAFPEWADLWIPLSLIEADLSNGRKYHPLEAIARLRAGVPLARAQAEIESISLQLAREHPDTNATERAYAMPLARELTAGVRGPLLLAWAAVGLVLLMACANVAHLFLARMSERRDELAIRAALGAGPWQLMRAALSEASLVAAIGGAAGIVAAAATLSLIRVFAGDRIPRFGSAGFTAPVWLFAASISILAVALFGLPAAWQMVVLRAQLVAGGRSLVRGRSRLSAALIAGEVALALFVLAGVALLARNFAALLDTDPGFRAENIWTAPNLPLRRDWTESQQFLATRLAPALLRVPGVVDVAGVNAAPMSLAPTEHSRFATRFGVDGLHFDSGSYPVAQNRWITPEYLRALGVPLEQGRWLAPGDLNKPYILVNRTLAMRFFPRGDAVGKQLVFGVMDPKQSNSEIVGVVGDVRDMGMDQEVEPTVYGINTGPVVTLILKTAPGSRGISRALRDAIRAVDPEIPVTRIQPLEANVAQSLASRRLALTLLAIFGAMAAFLTAAGIYGLLAQSVQARLREFGLHAAVGAAPAQLVRLILNDALKLTAPGIVAGAILVLAFARLMRSYVYRLSPTDPVSLAGAASFVLLLAFAAAYLPARRAAAVDPAVALRSE
jgi:putative ABC transport system permease protein